VEYIFVIHQATGCKTDGQILSLDSRPSSSKYDIAKTINFNDVTDYFVYVQARKNTL
jgi:hypothetical protein